MSITAALLTAALLLSGCGGNSKSPTTTTTPSAPPTVADDPNDVRRAGSLTPVAADLTAASQAVDPNRANKQPPQPTDYSGNPDFKAQREQCEVAFARGQSDTAAVSGANLLIADPKTAKTLSISSNANISRAAATVDAKLAHLKDPSTIACMQRVIQERAEAERTKRNLNATQLTAVQTIDPIPLSGLGSKTVALRTHLVVTLQGSTPVDQYIDLLITYVDRAEIAITVETTGAPPSPEFDARLIDRVRGNAVRAFAAR